MKTGIRDFCIIYKEKLKNDKNIKKNKLDFFSDNGGGINFNINIQVSWLNMKWTYKRNLFRLDEEDLEYLYKKYSKKIKDEMEQNIAEIKDIYKDALFGSEQFICSDCGKDTVEWSDGLCEDCTLKGFK